MEPAIQCLGAEALQKAISAGVVAGMKELATDAEFIEHFWSRGYKHLTEHAANGTSQWIGKRILTALVLSAVTGGIVWLVKTGALK